MYYVLFIFHVLCIMYYLLLFIIYFSCIMYYLLLFIIYYYLLFILYCINMDIKRIKSLGSGRKKDTKFKWSQKTRSLRGRNKRRTSKRFNIKRTHGGACRDATTDRNIAVAAPAPNYHHLSHAAAAPIEKNNPLLQYSQKVKVDNLRNDQIKREMRWITQNPFVAQNVFDDIHNDTSDYKSRFTAYTTDSRYKQEFYLIAYESMGAIYKDLLWQFFRLSPTNEDLKYVMGSDLF